MVGVPMSVPSAEVQRLRIRYAVSGALIYIAVLDSRRIWERMLRRAKLALSYSQGYHPHPKLYFAAARPVGYHSEGEVVDVILANREPLAGLIERIQAVAPPGLAVQEIAEVPVDADKPQSLMRRARYRVDVWSGMEEKLVEEHIADFMRQTSAVRNRLGRDKEYDLRPLVYEINYLGSQPDSAFGAVPRHRFEMLTRCGSQGSGRPEEIIDELDIPFEHQRIYRTELIWKET